MAKAAAMLTILVSSTLIGCRMAGRLRLRLQLLKRLDAFFRALHNRMAYSRAPLAALAEAALADRDDPLLGRFAALLADGLAPQAAWDEAFWCAAAEDDAIACLTAPDAALLGRYIATLGTSGLRSQQAYADTLFQELAEAIQDAEARYTGKARIYRSLGVLGGAAASILLL